MSRIAFAAVLWSVLTVLLPSMALAETPYEVSVTPRSWDTPLSGCRAVIDEKHRIFVYGGARNSVRDGKVSFDFEGRLRQSQAGDSLAKPWKTVEPSGTAPTPRSYGSLVLGRKGRSLFLFGGYDPGFTNELWQFDLKKKSWQRLDVDTKSPAPAARDAHVACDDGTGKGMLVFGGLGKGKIDAELWHWSYKRKQWKHIPKEGRWPGPRFTSGLCKIARHRAVVFGGLDGAAQATAETWALDTRKFTWKRLADGPARLSAPAVVWHPRLARVIALGGAGADGLATTGIWCFDPGANHWSKVGDLSQAVAHATGVYCARSDRIILVGVTVSHFGAEHPLTLVQEVAITKRAG